jgi:hypothetical protein
MPKILCGVDTNGSDNEGNDSSTSAPYIYRVEAYYDGSKYPSVYDYTLSVGYSNSTQFFNFITTVPITDELYTRYDSSTTDISISFTFSTSSGTIVTVHGESVPGGSSDTMSVCGQYGNSIIKKVNASIRLYQTYVNGVECVYFNVKTDEWPTTTIESSFQFYGVSITVINQ